MLTSGVWLLWVIFGCRKCTLFIFGCEKQIFFLVEDDRLCLIPSSYWHGWWILAIIAISSHRSICHEAVSPHNHYVASRLVQTLTGRLALERFMAALTAKWGICQYCVCVFKYAALHSVPHTLNMRLFVAAGRPLTPFSNVAATVLTILSAHMWSAANSFCHLVVEAKAWRAILCQV